MRAKCRIRTSAGHRPGVPHLSTSRQLNPATAFPTDSKTLISFSKPHTGPRCFAVPRVGVGRAITEAPVNFKVLQPKAVRREL